MKVGSLVKRSHIPYTYGIIVSITWRAVWVYWVGNNTKSGYEPSTASMSFEIINEDR
mgnify:CR=1 FL=1